MKNHSRRGLRWVLLTLLIAALLLPMSLPRQAQATEGSGPGGKGSEPVEGPPYAQAAVGDKCAGADLHAVQVDLVGATLDAETQPIALTSPGAGIQSLSGSYAGFENCVNNARQGASCYTAGTPGQYCFIAEFAGDEYATDVWLKFPSDWAVTSLSLWYSTGCQQTGEGGYGYWAPNLRLYWPTAATGCTLWVCVTGTPPTGTTSTQYVSWYLHGSGAGTTCSDDNYTPPYTGWPTCAEAVESQATVPACNSSNVDGVWGQIDGGGDADCSRWATGWKDGGWLMAFWDDALWTQTDTGSYCTGRNTDWNQVRYGIPYGDDACDENTDFYAQSGFRFDGEDDVRADLADTTPGDPFILGRFCHDNDPLDGILTTNFLDYVAFSLTVNPLVCPGLTPTPDPTSLTFPYTFGLDETDNCPAPGSECYSDECGSTEYCPYGPGDHGFEPGDSRCPYVDSGPNGNGCADQVTISQAAELPYQCGSTTYTISALGFIDELDGGCTSYNSDLLSAAYTSGEVASNCACLWARVIQPLSVDLKRFEAWPEGTAIHVQWETAQEIDNLGFNLYRSNTREGAKVKLNKQLIPTLVPPGSPFGAVYDWIDSFRLRPRRAYFYWLEDVDLSGNATMHGPVRVRMP